ncbi:MAG: intracellular sulfur oxidation DsrE/DsrF family protein [Candidatus Azotimanducaceae bacterium]|jgi:intracellular sulfur oxidation DsrE/DsrF family protein
MTYWKFLISLSYIFFTFTYPKAIANETFVLKTAIENFGDHVAVDQSSPIKSSQVFKVVFDVGRQNNDGGINQSFDSLARFINMHVANGSPIGNINLALVIHGKAAFDSLNKKAYEERFLAVNPNTELLNALMENNVKIYLCGQTAGFLSIGKKELQAGIKMSLSAMTAHALLQQEGYTLNPF